MNNNDDNDDYLEEDISGIYTEYENADETLSINRYLNSHILDNSGIDILDNSGTAFVSLTPFLNRIMNSIDDTIESAISREVSFLEKPVYKTVLTKEGEEKLKKIKFKDSEKKNLSCPILFIDFDEEEEIVELECNHCFNEDAIKKWLKEEKAECPVCRYQLKDTKDEKIETIKYSRDDIRNNMRREYVNFLSDTVNTIYETEEELRLQRLLMEQYTHYE
tara:strand:- start:13972 stop:14631 length:660 start_codon:yes stop_codon:yes gene_type:complete